MTFKSKMYEAGKTMGQVIKSVEGGPAPADILETLKKEHDEVKQLLKDLVDSDRAAERKTLLKKIRQALVPHTKAEEKVVYDAILTVRGGGEKAKIDGNEGYYEHEMASAMLTKLGKITQATSPQFSAAAKVLKELVGHHIEEEERNVWADVRQHFSTEERAAMNAQFEVAKKKVKVAA